MSADAPLVDLARVEEKLMDLVVAAQRAATAYERGATGEMREADSEIVAIKVNLLATVTRLAEANAALTASCETTEGALDHAILANREDMERLRIAQEDNARLRAALEAWVQAGTNGRHAQTCPECLRSQADLGRWCPTGASIADEQLLAADQLRAVYADLATPRPTPPGEER